MRSGSPSSWSSVSDPLALGAHRPRDEGEVRRTHVGVGHVEARGGEQRDRRPERLVVHDDDEHHHVLADREVEIAERHHDPAVADEQRGEPVGTAERRADRRAQPATDRAELLHVQQRVGRLGVHAPNDVRHEATAVGHDRAVRREQLVQARADRPGVQRACGGLVLERIRARPLQRRPHHGIGADGRALAHARAHAREKRFRDGARVAGDGRARAPVAPERLGVAVAVDDVGVRHEGLLVRREAVEPCADGEHAVAGVRRLLHRGAREAADEPEIGGMPAEQAARRQRRAEHGAERVGEVAQRVGRAGAERPAPSKDERALRGAQALHGRIELRRIELGGRGLRVGRDGRLARVRDLVLVGHDHRDRSEIARGGHERRVDVARDRLGLGADDGDVGGLQQRRVGHRLHPRERVLGRADRGGVAGEEHERRVRLAGRDERRDRVRQPGALRDDADADAPGGSGEPVGRRDRPGLVARGVVGHLEIVLEVVQDPHVPRAHDPEHVNRALGCKRSSDCLGEGHLRRHLSHCSPSF